MNRIYQKAARIAGILINLRIMIMITIHISVI